LSHGGGDFELGTKPLHGLRKVKREKLSSGAEAPAS
jgi:hypothetical protein